jgi:hypothetical protein
LSSQAFRGKVRNGRDGCHARAAWGVSRCCASRRGGATGFGRWAAAVGLAWLLAGCTPSLDWREFRPEGAQSLRALFPCKPDGHARLVKLGTLTVRLTLHACRADGSTWGLAWADVGDPTQVGPTLQALQAGFRDNLAASASVAHQGWRVAGATPHPASGRWTLQGKWPDGGALHGDVAVFSQGTRVFQASVLSDRTRVDDVEAFMAALKVGD